MKLLSRIDVEIAVFFGLVVLLAAAILQLTVKSVFNISSSWLPVYGYAFAGGLLLALLAFRFRLSLALTMAASIAIPLVLLGHMSSLLIVVFQWAVVFCLGILFTSRRVETNDDVASTLIIGYVVYSVALLCLVHLGLFNPWVIGTFHLLPIAAACWFSRDKLGPWPLGGGKAGNPGSGSRFMDLSVLVLVLAGAIILVFFAAVPDNGSDSITAYRPMITDLLQDGTLTIDPTKRTINLVPLIELWGQSASALLANNLHAVKIWNLSIFLFAYYVLLSAGQRVAGRKTIATGFLAVSATTMVPLFYNVTLSAFMDNSALLMTAVMVFWSMKITARVNKGDGLTTQNAFWAGLILGLAFITKYTLIFSIFPLSILLFIYIFFAYELENMKEKIVVIIFTSLILPLCYMGFVYYITGNPFFPYENASWKSDYFQLDVFRSVHAGYLHPALFWDMTVNTQAYSVSGAVDGTLGISYLFGAVVAFYVIARALVRRDISAGVWVTAAAFLISTVMLSWMQNSARYIAPTLAFLVPAVFFVLQGARKELWTGFFIAMLFCNIAMIPRYGYGSGTFVLADATKVAHEAAYETRLDRQRVADNLSRQYGMQGRIVDLRGRAISIGETLEYDWYDYFAAARIGVAIREGATSFTRFLVDENIDAVVVGRGAANVGKAILAVLRDSSRQVDQEGSLLVFHLKDEIRFDRFIDVPEIAGKQRYQVTPEKGSYVWQVDYACGKSGSILRVNIVDGKWRDSVSDLGLCDDRQASWRSRLLTANGKDSSFVMFLQFPEDLQIKRAGIWHRQE